MKECKVKLSKSYLNYLKVVVKIDEARSYECAGLTIYPDLSVQDSKFGQRQDEEFLLVQRGDGCREDMWLVQFEDGQTAYVKSKDVVHVEGTGATRNVRKRGKIVASGLMGCVCKGIRTGKAFRGR